jgi:hypothetical protein
MSTVTPIRAIAAVHTFHSPEMSRAAVNGMNAVIGAASTDQVRALLTYVQVSITDNTMRFVTTNSYRANRVTIALLDSCPDVKPFLVNAKELKSQLPRAIEFKSSGLDRLTIGYYPGDRELDPAQLHFTWGNNQRILQATPDGAGLGTWPNVEQMIDGAVADKVVTNEPVCYNPAFIADIAKECKLINKDRFVKVTPGASPMKPAMFTTKALDEPVYYESLLMPVRE